MPAVTICLDIAANPHDFPWFLKEDGEDIGQVLDVENADATDDELIAALRAQFPSACAHLAREQITIWRSGADDCNA